MEYQKTVNLLGNTLNQPTKFRTINWVEINGNSCGMYNTKLNLIFKSNLLFRSVKSNSI